MICFNAILRLVSSTQQICLSFRRGYFGSVRYCLRNGQGHSYKIKLIVRKSIKIKTKKQVHNGSQSVTHLFIYYDYGIYSTVRDFSNSSPKSPHKDKPSEPPEPVSAMRYIVQTSYPFPFLLPEVSIRHVQNACNCGSSHDIVNIT